MSAPRCKKQADDLVDKVKEIKQRRASQPRRPPERCTESPVLNRFIAGRLRRPFVLLTRFASLALPLLPA